MCANEHTADANKGSQEPDNDAATTTEIRRGHSGEGERNRCVPGDVAVASRRCIAQDDLIQQFCRPPAFDRLLNDFGKKPHK